MLTVDWARIVSESSGLLDVVVWGRHPTNYPLSIGDGVRSQLISYTPATYGPVSSYDYYESSNSALQGSPYVNNYV